MEYGEREIRRGCEGPDVVELQLRLAGFRGTLPDGQFGPGTERQVMSFQRDYMKLANSSGRADGATLRAIDDFAERFPLDFNRLRCPCGECSGFGSGRNRGVYRTGQPRAEAWHLYEYPGMHRLLLWAVRALFFHLPGHGFVINSGYRCGIDNARHGRSSTNHHGKAIDLDITSRAGECRADHVKKCDEVRGCLVHTADAQVGWGAPNRKALEPCDLAPTWVHYDVRSYESRYLSDDMYCIDLAGLDRRRPIRI